MSNFLQVLGILVMILGSLGGLIMALGAKSGEEIGIAYIFASLCSGALLNGFGKLLELVGEIRNTVVDETLPVVDKTYEGRKYRVLAFRENGKLGALYEFPNSTAIRVEPRFVNIEKLHQHIQSEIQSSRP